MKKRIMEMRAICALFCAALLLSGCGSRPEIPEELAPQEATLPVPEDMTVLIREDHEGVDGDYSVEYAYDDAGRLTRKTARGDQITDFTYYPNGNLKEEVLRIYDDRFGGNIRHSRAYRQDGTLEKTVDNAYGSNGRQTGEETVLFDEKGNPISSTFVVYNDVANSDKTIANELYTLTYENTYDDQGRLTHRLQTRTDSADLVEETWWYGTNGETTHRQDFITAGRLGHRETTVTNADGKVLTYVWESSDSYPAHRAEYSVYDDQGNLLLREYTENDLAGGAHMGTVSGGTTHYTNVYSKDGLLSQTMERASSYYYDGFDMTTETVPGHTAVRYTYDGEGRMVSACHMDVHGNALYTVTWEYDGEGNLICHADESLGTVTYTYAPLSSLKSN